MEKTMNKTIDLVWLKIQIAIAAIGSEIGFLVGELDGLLITLLVFMVLDYISGVMCAIEDRKLSSSVGFKGICRKVSILMLVGVGHVLDTHVIGSGSALRTAVICFYLSNEGVSLLENTSHLGLPVPRKLKTVLEQVHKRADDNEKVK